MSILRRIIEVGVAAIALFGMQALAVSAEEEETESAEQAAAIDEELKPLVEQLGDFDKSKRLDALQQIDKLRDKRRYLVYSVAEHVCLDTDREVRVAAERVLKKFEPKVVPLLKKLFAAKEEKEQIKLAKAIGELGPRGEAAAGVLVLIMGRYHEGKPESVEIVSACLNAVERTTPRHRDIQGFVGQVASLNPQEQLRLAAISALVAIAKAHPQHKKDAMSYLYIALQCQHASVRAAVVAGLVEVADDDRQLHRKLEGLAKDDEDENVREAAALALETLANEEPQ